MPSEIVQTTPTSPNRVNYITLEILTFTREEKGNEVPLSRKATREKSRNGLDETVRLQITTTSCEKRQSKKIPICKRSTPSIDTLYPCIQSDRPMLTPNQTQHQKQATEVRLLETDSTCELSQPISQGNRHSHILGTANFPSKTAMPPPTLTFSHNTVHKRLPCTHRINSSFDRHKKKTGLVKNHFALMPFSN